LAVGWWYYALLVSVKKKKAFDLVGSGQNNRDLNYFKTKLSSNFSNNTYKAKERI
jgi:hypothetical protein